MLNVRRTVGFHFCFRVSFHPISITPAALELCLSGTAVLFQLWRPKCFEGSTFWRFRRTFHFVEYFSLLRSQFSVVNHVYAFAGALPNVLCPAGFTVCVFGGRPPFRPGPVVTLCCPGNVPGQCPFRLQNSVGTCVAPITPAPVTPKPAPNPGARARCSSANFPDIWPALLSWIVRLDFEMNEVF